MTLLNQLQEAYPTIDRKLLVTFSKGFASDKKLEKTMADDNSPQFNQDRECVEVNMRGYITMEAWWETDIDPKYVKAGIDLATSKNCKLQVNLNSFGGDYYAGVEIAEALASFEKSGGDIRVDVVGFAASAATLPLLKVKSQNIFISEFAEVMIHNPSTYCYGDINQVEKSLNSLKKLTSTVCSLYSKRMGVNEVEVKKMLDDETYLDASESIKYNLASELLADSENFKEDKATDEQMIALRKNLAIALKQHKTITA